ncbi:Protein of unknown function [Pyronema omphalodes CBS 100304]|uniref:Uncharacterized protein n=1 Tax=Pyronema omphalodes (strain CBS 100304) TaxID=1076935 RepID=U4L0E7_PYROM|nr:Protein of unknown function [Pyronema omphalodes CBS 100304]
MLSREGEVEEVEGDTDEEEEGEEVEGDTDEEEEEEEVEEVEGDTDEEEKAEEVERGTDVLRGDTENRAGILGPDRRLLVALVSTMREMHRCHPAAPPSQMLLG